MKVFENKMLFAESYQTGNGNIRNKTTIFDLGPKERYRMLKEVHKHRIQVNACKQ